MAKDKDARRFAILGIDRCIAQNLFDPIEPLSKRMFAISMVERALYESARQDKDLELEETENELSFRQSGHDPRDFLKLSIESNLTEPYRTEEWEKFYQKIKKEFLNDGGHVIDGNEVNGLAWAEKQTSTLRTAPKGIALS